MIWVLHISHKHGDSFGTLRKRGRSTGKRGGWARRYWVGEEVSDGRHPMRRRGDQPVLQNVGH